VVTIEIKFLAGRFHATPWDRHVNEGGVEWPLSPWRFLRALIAVGFRKLGWEPDRPPQEARQLIELLADELPEYWLPPASTGHTRHYMPKYRSSLDGKTDKVIDAFVALSPQNAMIMHWPDTKLDAGLKMLLGKLLDGLSYIGRAESWVEAKILKSWCGQTNAFPIKKYPEKGDYERVSILASMTGAEYESWRSGWMKSREPGRGAQKKRQGAQRGTAPKHLFDSMMTDTGELRSFGWNIPPGSRWVDYLRPTDCFNVKPMRHILRKRARPVIAHYALTADSVHADVRPRVVNGLHLADNLRKALMSLTAKENNGVPSITFSGKDEQGRPLRGHQHAFFIPLDDDEDGRIDSIAIYAPKGFTDLDVVAMGRLRRLWQHGGRPGLLPVLLGIGLPEDFIGRNSSSMLTRAITKSHRWESRSPFVLVRYPKVRRNGQPKLRDDGTWIDGPEDQLKLEIRRQGLPEPVSIKWLKHAKLGGRNIQWQSFAKRRTGGGGSFAGGGYGFEITFREEVAGPLALGYGCHFGLGQFSASC